MKMKICVSKLYIYLALLLIGYQNITSMYWQFSSSNADSFLSIMMIIVVIASLHITFRKPISTTNIVFIMILYYLYILCVCIFNGYYDLFIQEPTMLFTMSYWMFLFCLFYGISNGYTISIQKLSSIIFALTIVCFVLFLRYYSTNLKTGGLSGLNVVYYITFMLPFILVNKRKKIGSIGMAINLFVALLSGKRGALIAVAISWIIWMNSNLKNQPSKKKILKTFQYLIICIVAVFIIEMIINKLGLDIMDRMMEIISGEDDTGSGRTKIWSSYIDYMMSDNIINTFFGRGYISAKRNPELSSLNLGWAHNDFIQVMFDYGIIGLFVFCIIIIKFFKYSLRMKKRGYEFHKQYLISLVIFIICSCFSMVTIYPQWFLSMAAFWGIIIGDYEKKVKGNII